MINLMEVIILNTFVENFEKYKKLKNSGYESKKYLESIEMVVLLLIPVILGVFSFVSQSGFLMLLTITIFIFLIVSYPLITLYLDSEGYYLRSKYDEIYRIEKMLNEKIFTGSLFEIFNKECEVTNKVLKENKDFLNVQIHEYKGVKGYKIIEIWNEIIIKKERNEEMEVMKSCNTKTGRMFKEVEDL